MIWPGVVPVMLDKACFITSLQGEKGRSYKIQTESTNVRLSQLHKLT